jgi:hypothetical protein
MEAEVKSLVDLLPLSFFLRHRFQADLYFRFSITDLVR